MYICRTISREGLVERIWAKEDVRTIPWTFSFDFLFQFIESVVVDTEVCCVGIKNGYGGGRCSNEQDGEKIEMHFLGGIV